jgi:DNA-binding MarR family transcriptional regulator
MKAKQPRSEMEIRAFRAALRTLVRKINRQLKDDTSCCGLGFLPCHILLELDGREGLSLRDLQKEMETDKAALSRAVDALVNDGQVSRKENPEDRRNIVIELTAVGRKKVSEIHRHCDRKYQKLFDVIPEKEHASVVCAVNYLAQAFDELGSEAMYCVPEKRKTS